jgi:hypothetical protein
MPTFEIPDGPTTIDAPRSGAATAVFSVTNTSSDGCDARLSVVLSGGSKKEWFSVDGNRERNFASGESQTVSVTIRVPADAPAGDYQFRLRAVAVNDPDNDHIEGPMTVARLGPVESAKPKTSLLWLWILIGIVVALLIAVALYFLLRSKTPEAAAKIDAPATAAPPAEPAKAQGPKDRLSTGGRLEGKGSEAIVSSNGYFRAVMQSDCNFVVYHPPRPLWASGTQGRGSACWAVMQGDGNLVVYTQDGAPVWASGTQGNANAEVVMQDDGNLVVYSAGRALWASNTVVQ